MLGLGCMRRSTREGRDNEAAVRVMAALTDLERGLEKTNERGSADPRTSM